MIYKSISKAKKETGLTYLGSVNLTTKHMKAYDYNEMCYTLYLAPADISGYEVCPMRNEECTALCLNESGLNRMNMKGDMITQSRIKKTKLFFEHREYFMSWLIDEITVAQKRANEMGYNFSVRLNNTSDVSPESFYIIKDGKPKNVLQLFPDVIFYDYTKVFNRARLVEKYPNYDLTYSFSGTNFNECLIVLNEGCRVAVVFKKKVPETFWGYKVIDGDAYDMRYHDDGGLIVGLKYKRTRTKVKDDSKFIVNV